MSDTSAFAALRHPQFRLLWSGQVISSLGNAMQTFALGWLVVEIAIRDGVPQRAPLYLGFVGLSRAAPGLVFGVIGGVIADRIDRRLILLVTQGSAAVVAALLSALVFSGRAEIASIMLLNVLAATAFTMEGPVRQSTGPRLVPARAIVSAVGVTASAANASAFVGPLLGGVLIEPLGVGGLLLLQALANSVTVALVLGLHPLPPTGGAPPERVVDSLRGGLRYVSSEPVVLSVLCLFAIAALIARSYTQLMPAVAHETLRAGAVELSWLLGASGAGALAGAFTGASLGGIERRGVVLGSAVTALGGLVFLFGLQLTLVPALVLAGLSSYAGQVFMILGTATLNGQTPDHLRGRVLGIAVTLVQGLIQLGTLLIGSLGTVIGTSHAISVGGGVLALIGVVVALRLRPLRDLRSSTLIARPVAGRGGLVP